MFVTAIDSPAYEGTASGVGGIITGAGAPAQSSEVNSPEEEALGKRLLQMFAQARRWKSQFEADRKRWWDLWESNHHLAYPPRTLSQVVVNQVWSAVETFLGHISDIIPSPLVYARHPAYRQKALVIKKWLEYEAEVNNIESEIQHPIRSAAVTGEGWLAVEFDPSAFGGRGDVCIYPVSERSVYYSPGARNLRECLYIIEARNVPRDLVARLHPDRGPSVPIGPLIRDLSVLSAYKGKAGPGMGGISASTTDRSATTFLRPRGESGMDELAASLVSYLRCWIRQDDGSMRLTILGNGVVLQDGPSPYWDDDYPYVVFNLIPTLDGMHGRGLMQFIEGLQAVLNDTMSLIVDQQRFASDPMLIVDAANLSEGEVIENCPGAILPNNSQGGQGYWWLQGPGFNQAWLQVQEVINSYMDSVLGRVDILRGERPVGVNTLGGLEIVRDQANVRLRSMARWINASLKRMFLLALSRLQQFVKDERVLRIQGKRGEEYVTVNEVKRVTPAGEIVRDITIPDEAEFDITFGRESLGGQQARRELAITLSQQVAEDGLPMVDRQYVLEQCDVEETPEIIARLQERAEAEAQAQAQAVAPAGPGGEGEVPPPSPGGAQAPPAGVSKLDAVLDAIRKIGV